MRQNSANAWEEASFVWEGGRAYGVEAALVWLVSLGGKVFSHSNLPHPDKGDPHATSIHQKSKLSPHYHSLKVTYHNMSQRTTGTPKPTVFGSAV